MRQGTPHLYATKEYAEQAARALQVGNGAPKYVSWTYTVVPHPHGGVFHPWKIAVKDEDGQFIGYWTGE